MPFFCIHCSAEIDSKYKACPFCGEPITEFLRRYLDAPIDGKYKILSRLGVGGMGEVYKVLHIHLNAIRVIKLMRASIVNDAGAHDRFLREARLATRIQHPNVAALFDFSTLEEGSRYMVWEYIEGINLHELIDSHGPLSPRYAATLAVQTLHGLEAIHRAGIVHRDISPENLMIAREQDGEEKVKIIDLGIAKQWSGEQENHTKTGMFVGKWKYCSPEHLGLLRDGERIDGRADLYSFGIVLYEMLTGVPPFQADMPHEYLMMHSTEMPRPLREVNPGVTASPELEAVIFRALRKERMRRFRSASEFAHELEKLIPGLDDTAGAARGRVTAATTAEATRLLPKRGGEVEVRGPVDGDRAGKTVHTDVSYVLNEFPPVLTPRPRRLFPYIAPLAIVAAIAIGAATMLQNRVEPVSIAARPSRVDASVVAMPQGHLGINAYPWANVTNIRNLDSGRTVALKAPFVTPAPIDLAPGRYEVTLSNPAYPRPIVKTVDVKAGQEQMIHAPFADASQLTLPKFAGSPQ